MLSGRTESHRSIVLKPHLSTAGEKQSWPAEACLRCTCSNLQQAPTHAYHPLVHGSTCAERHSVTVAIWGACGPKCCNSATVCTAGGAAEGHQHAYTSLNLHHRRVLVCVHDTMLRLCPTVSNCPGVRTASRAVDARHHEGVLIILHPRRVSRHREARPATAFLFSEGVPTRQ